MVQKLFWVSTLCTGMDLPLYQAQQGWPDYQFECNVDLRTIDPGTDSYSPDDEFKFLLCDK
jgi:hypothetical protein